MLTTLTLPLATGFLILHLAVVEFSECIPLRSKRAFSYIANETACTVDHIVYRAGDPIPTDDPCETCRCRPPGFNCILRECEIKTGCRAIRRMGECCPLYQCGCEHNGKYYSDGERIPNAESPCYSCYCQGSSITCSLADCKFRFDCEPEYIIGECCPRYDHCPTEFDFEPITVRSTMIPRLSTAFVPTTARPTSIKPTTLSTTLSISNSSFESKPLNSESINSEEAILTTLSVSSSTPTPEVRQEVSAMSSTTSMPVAFNETSVRDELPTTAPTMVSDLPTTELNRDMIISLTTITDLESLNVTTVIPTLITTESPMVVELSSTPPIETTSLRDIDSTDRIEIDLGNSSLNTTQPISSSSVPAESTLENISDVPTTEASLQTNYNNTASSNSNESTVAKLITPMDLASWSNDSTLNVTVLAELLPETTTTESSIQSVAASLNQSTTPLISSEDMVITLNVTSEVEEKSTIKTSVDSITTASDFELTTEKMSDTESSTPQLVVTTSI